MLISNKFWNEFHFNMLQLFTVFDYIIDNVNVISSSL